MGGSGHRPRRRIANLRFTGQDSTLSVEPVPGVSLHELFGRRYQEVFGHRPEGRPIELESIRVVASSPLPTPPDLASTPAASDAVPEGRQRARFAGAWVSTPVYQRDRLPAGIVVVDDDCWTPKAAAVGPQIEATFAKAWKAGVTIAFGTERGVIRIPGQPAQPVHSFERHLKIFEPDRTAEA